MRNCVNEWKQEGRLFIWRYPRPNSSWRGWQFTGDPAGCRSIRNLLDRMKGGPASYRTLDLAPVTEEILRVPNYKYKTLGKFDKLRVQFDPGAKDLALEPEGQKLTLTVGDGRLQLLAAAFAQVEIGEGDFGIGPSDDRKPDPWMFWWMPKDWKK